MKAEVEKRLSEFRKVRKIGEYSAYQAANIITWTLYKEARGEGETGLRMVASVIYNRANGKKENFVKACIKHNYSKKAKKEIYQFSCWNDIQNSSYWNSSTYKPTLPKEIYKSDLDKASWEKCRDIAAEMLSDSFTPITDANMYYAISLKKIPTWDKELTNIKIVKNHKFGYLKNHSKFI